jgi:hypothetical protein
MVKDGVRTVVVGTAGTGVVVAGAGIDDAGISRPAAEFEKAVEAKGNHDANGICRPYGGPLQCSSGKVEVCACCVASCLHVQLVPLPQQLQQLI